VGATEHATEPAGGGGRTVGRVALFALTGTSLYLLAPGLVEVFSSAPRLREIRPWWLGAMVGLQVGSFVCTWLLQRIAIRCRSWFAVATSQLAGNAFGRVVPGGGAAAGALQYRMLVEAGTEPAAAASGLTASALLTFGILLALPVLSLPALLTRPVADGLARGALAGLAVLLVMLAGGAVSFATDRPLELLGRATQRVRNRLRRRRPPLTDLPARLLRERDLILGVLGRRWWEALLAGAGKWVLDYLTLLAALVAVGAGSRPSLVLLAYCTAQLLGQIPITPGGLGFVEAGLTGTLALAGVDAADAVLATLAYRLVSYWLPIPAGLAATVLHRRRLARAG